MSKIFMSESSKLARKIARRQVTLRDARRAFERLYVVHTIARCKGDRREAARRLDIGFSTLKEKIRHA